MEHVLFSGKLTEKFIEMGPMGYSFDDGPAELVIFNKRLFYFLRDFYNKNVKIVLVEEGEK